MSLGLSLITALLAGDRRGGMRQLREIYFTSEERAAWNFLNSYHFNHGGFPSPEAFAENGITLTPATGNFSYHLERAKRRAVYGVVQENHQAFLDAMTARDMDAVVDRLDIMQREAAAIRAADSASSMTDWADRVRDSYAEARRNGDVNGITLGYEPLDRLTHGAYPGDVVVLVGRPAEGKSYTISHMALAAWRGALGVPRKRVLFLTMEMTAEQIAHRLIGLNAGLNPSYIRTGHLSQHVYPAFQQSLSDFDDHGGEFHLVSGDLRKSVRDVDSLIQDVEPDIVYVDASYLLKPEAGHRSQSRWEVLADVGEGLKSVALARRLPIVHTVQFNRQAKAKTRGDYDLDMIGGTDVVGQVATIAIGIRPGASPHERTRRRFNIMKNRDGDKGRFTTNFLFQPLDFNVIVDQSDVRNDPAAMRAQEQQMTDLSGSML